MFRFIAFFALVAAASAEITELCADDRSFSCVAAHLEQVAGCIPPAATDATVFDVPRYLIEVPYWLGSVDRYQSTFEGLQNAEITAFYTDSELDRTVLSVKWPEIVGAGRENIWYHSAGQLDQEVDTAFENTYVNVIATAQWVGVDSITIGTARVYLESEAQLYTLEDFSELDAAIEADPTGRPAVVASEAAAQPDILRDEHILYVGRAAARVFWKNFLCSNLE